MNEALTTITFGSDGETRCAWCASVPEYLGYHDSEWGFPVTDDRLLFEKICLEGFQSGLSWLTILRKREGFRLAFENFDFHAIARYTAKDVERLLGDSGIVRNRRKIEAVINNAQRAVEMVGRSGALATFVWSFAPPRSEAPIVPMPATSPESIALSAELKKLGWKFVGPTNMYAFMQAMGLVNDHAPGCVMRAKVELARERIC